MQGIGDGNLPVEFDPFNTPIPGQSLTDEPGNYPWEHAPKNVDPEIILERTWRGMTTPEAVEEMIYLLDAGVPAEAIARTIVFAGFMQGEFTPDVGFTLAEPIMEMIIAIGMRAGIENLRVSLHDTENREFKKNMVKLKEARKNSLKEMEELKLPNETKNEDKLQGLLAKPEEIE